MNPTPIEWASLNMPGGSWTWNPVVGCGGGCPYCYAAKQAKRQPCELCKSFTPHLHEERLWQPAQRRKPSGVFVGSMCDLWDPAVDELWRKRIWDAMFAAPQHRYAILTKRPDVAWDQMPIGWSDTRRNMQVAVGVSVDHDGDLWRLSELKRSSAPLLFVSFEPLQGAFRRQDVEEDLSCIDWAIIGAETGRRPGRVVPEWVWVEEIVTACNWAGVPVFLKDNLHSSLPPCYPFRQEWPEVWE